MKRSSFLFAVISFFSVSAMAQTDIDKSEIYRTVIKTYVPTDLPIINETISRIYKYDIDGDYNKWLHQTGNSAETDTLMLTGWMICVIPTQYSQTVADYFASKNVSANFDSFLRQANDVVLDSLSKYVSDNKMISVKNASLSHSRTQSIFKKNRAVSVSNILFDEQGKNAIVKMEVSAKNKSKNGNQSKIVLLTKVDEKWIIADILNEKMITM